MTIDSKPKRSLFGSPAKDVIPSVVNQDHPCLFCSYNLRSMSIEAQCPECGTSVRNSFLSNKLVFCNPAWVSRISNGAMLAAAGMIPWAFISTMVKVNSSLVGWWQFWIGTAITSVPALITFAGVILLTAREPKTRVNDESPLLRRITRTAAVLWFTVTLFGVASRVMAYLNFSYFVSGGPIAQFGFSKYFEGILMFCTLIVSLKYVQQIAPRSSAPGLGQFARFLILGLFVITALIVGVIAILFGGTRPDTILRTTFITVTGCSSALWNLFLLFFTVKLAFALMHDRKSARGFWQTMRDQAEQRTNRNSNAPK